MNAFIKMMSYNDNLVYVVMGCIAIAFICEVGNAASKVFVKNVEEE